MAATETLPILSEVQHVADLDVGTEGRCGQPHQAFELALFCTAAAATEHGT